MSYETLLVTVEGSLGRIHLNRPKERNPLSNQTSGEIVRAMEAHFGNPEVRSLVISAEGDAFCAGGDLRQMQAFKEMEPAEAWAWPSDIVRAQKMMLDAPKPVMAAVNGPAAAGGMGLAGMCDIILATPSAKFSVPEAKIGLFPMIIVAQLARSLPRKRLLEMMLTGNPISAQEAKELGFVTRILPDAAAMDEAVKDYARQFESVSPTAIRLGRKAFGLLSEMPAHAALDAAQFLNLPFFLGHDLHEGATAFLERRAPQWREDRG